MCRQMDASLINADKPTPQSVLSSLVGVGWAMSLQVLAQSAWWRRSARVNSLLG